MNRGVAKVGKRRGPRWSFHLLDALQIRVLGDMCIRLPLNPTFVAPLAIAVANAVKDNAVQETDRDTDGKLINEADGFRPNINIIAGFNEDGTLLAYRVDTKDRDRSYPPKLADTVNAPLRRAHIIIPATATFHDVLLRVEELEELYVRQEEEMELSK